MDVAGEPVMAVRVYGTTPHSGAPDQGPMRARYELLCLFNCFRLARIATASIKS